MDLCKSNVKVSRKSFELGLKVDLRLQPYESIWVLLASCFSYCLPTTRQVINHSVVLLSVTSVLLTGITAWTGKTSPPLCPSLYRFAPLSLLLSCPYYCHKREIHPKKEDNRTQQIAKNEPESLPLTLMREIHEVGFHHPVVQGLGPAVDIVEGLVLVIQ